MARLKISDSTLKKLFALSGNCCAFPDCKEKMVDEKGNLIGQVCHIQAANIGGQRYNENHNDEERRSFSNLMIMCPNHHKETDKVEKYPSSLLTKIKSEHEAKFSKPAQQFKTPSEAIKQASSQINNFNFVTQQNISHGSPLTVHNHGLSKEETSHLISEIALALKPNAIHLTAEARKEADSRIKAFIQEEFSPKFIELSNRVSNLESKLISPDIQYSFNQVLQAVGRREDIGFNQSLANLMIARIESEDNSPQALIYNEAIIVFPKLTSTQLGILSFVFLAHSVNNFQIIDSREAFEQISHRNYDWFVDIKNRIKEIDFGHLEYSGCVIKDNPNAGFVEYLTNHFKFISHEVFIESRKLNFINELTEIHDNSEIKNLRLTSVGTVLAIHWLKVVANLDFQSNLWLEV